jgi:choline dehydrogenase-like flavoprotein
MVTELRQDVEGRTVQAEVVVTPTRRLSVRARVFVVAGGGLQSTRLLLASRRPGRDRGLGDERDQVGRNYMTHPVADVGPLLVDPALSKRLCSFQRTVDGIYARRFLAVRPSVRADEGLLNINLATWGPDPHDPSHGDGLLSSYALTKRVLIAGGLTAKTAGTHRFNGGRPLNLPAHMRNIGTTVPGTVQQAASWGRQRWLTDRQVPALLNPGRRGVLRVRFDAEQRPHPDNRVELLRERDAHGMPRLGLSYQVRAADRASYHRSLQLMQAELLRRGVGVLHLPPRDEFMGSLRLGNGTHQLGLLRMSSTSAGGVVDSDLRVHSSPNTYVLSTGVFPTAGAAPPTLTLVALALRLADTLSRRC